VDAAAGAALSPELGLGALAMTSARARLVCYLLVAFALAAGAFPPALLRAGEKSARKPAVGDLPAANRLLLSGKYAEAAEAFAKLVEKEPVAAAVGLARSQASTGELDKATHGLTACVEKHPDAADAWAELARLAFDRGDYAAAAKAAEAAIKARDNQFQARWIQAELLRVAGKLKEADAAYKWFVDYYNGHDVADPESLHWIGLGAGQFARWNRLSDQFHFLVNELYPDALKDAPDFWPANYEAGLLFLEKYNQADAARELKAALKINPNAAEVHAALAELALQNFELDAARRSADRALEINPKLLAAHLHRADILLANFQAAEAIRALEEARKLNPVSEATLGRLAAAYGVVDGLGSAGGKQQEQDAKVATRCGKLIEEAIARNEHCGEFFFALANALDQSRRFPAAANYYRQSVERMPQLIAPRNALGMMYMRLGEEVEAKKLLDEAFKIDPFNVRVNNSLKVLEVLDDYAVLETDHFVIKFDRAQDEILARYAAKYLEGEVYPELCKKFGYQPAGKSLFEIFNRARNTSGHGWFSARMVGLPYVGTVGACAGRMVALASPNDMPKKFNWARVLKHEFVHVLNLQQTEFSIPHWFTEALAVGSEGYARPQIWNQLLAERVPKGELLNLDTINLGFIRPNSSLDWQMAYCQADLYAQYMIATYGADAPAKMLAAYRDNLDTRSALKRCFDVAQEDFERGYLDHLKRLAAGLATRTQPAALGFAELVRAHEANPSDVELSAQLAAAYLARKEYPRARELAEKVLKEKASHQLASYVLARIHLVVGENQQALKLLEDALDREAPQENLLNLLAGLKLKAQKYDEAAALYQLGAAHEPSNSQWTKSLARVYLTAGNDAKLREVLVKLADLDADDFVIRKKLAQLGAAAKDPAATIRWAREALHIDVMDAEVHRMLAEALVTTAEPAAAAEEYEVAAKLEPKDPDVRLALARAYIDAKQPAAARKALQSLLEQSPDNEAAKKLLEGLTP
jgi:tetratricopeptide (TPR) repeat protein